MGHQVELVAYSPAVRTACGAILDAFPAWFGSTEANAAYLDDLETRPVFVVRVEGQMAGFMGLTDTSDASVDVHVIAVAPSCHGDGIGTALIARACAYAVARDRRFLTVKTLGPSRQSTAYAKTIAFYQAQGFAPLEEFPDFWGEGYPMLLMCQAVG